MRVCEQTEGLYIYPLSHFVTAPLNENKGSLFVCKGRGIRSCFFYICRISLKIWAKGEVRLLENRVSVLQ